jgi:hypothetical protein
MCVPERYLTTLQGASSEVDVSTCSLRIKNNSAATLFFFICHSLDGMQNGLAPVWQADELPPNGMRHIEWDADDISFAWAGMGPIAPDSRFEIGGTLPADAHRKALLDRVNDDTYTLMSSPDGPTPPLGSYVIASTNKVPPGRVAIGLTVGDNAYVAANTGPNLDVEFTLMINKLVIVRSNVLAPIGLLVPPELITKGTELDMGVSSNWVVSYELDDSWTVTPA